MTERAALSDYDALLAFENKVFEIDFQQKVPLLYADADVCASCHGLLRENGRIIAAVAAYPTELVTDCGTLRAIGVGSVAVASEARGRGCMGELLAFCNRRAEETDADLLFLGGARGRYERDGYLPCGCELRFDISAYFLRRFRPTESFRFSPLTADADGCLRAHALFSAQPLHWQRSSTDTFLRSVAGSGDCAYAVRRADGTFCGYLTVCSDRSTIGELVLCAADTAADVLAAFAHAQDCAALQVCVLPTQTNLIAALSRFADGMETRLPASFKVRNWRRFLEVLGTYKARHFAVLEGSLTLQIGTETLRVTIKDRRCTVVPTTDAPALCFSEKEAAVVLTTVGGALAPHPLFAAWAPLCPLGLPRADRV